jgi:hypothetical protein
MIEMGKVAEANVEGNGRNRPIKKARIGEDHPASSGKPLFYDVFADDPSASIDGRANLLRLHREDGGSGSGGMGGGSRWTRRRPLRRSHHGRPSSRGRRVDRGDRFR